MKYFLVFTLVFGSITVFAQESGNITVPQDTVEVKTTAESENMQPDNTLVNQEEQNSTQPEKESKFNKSKLYYGGYLNLSFGSYTRIGIEPLVGYKVTPKFSIGGKLSYNYIKDKRYTQEYTTNNFGFSLFTRYRVVPRIYGHAEFSSINYELFYTDGSSKREWVPFLFLGGGYSQPITKNSWLTAEVLFDVLQNENSPYKNWEPFFSIGVGVGF